MTGELASGKKGTNRTVPLDAVTEVSVRKFSTGRTAELVAFSATGFVLFVIAGCEITDCEGVNFGTPAAGR